VLVPLAYDGLADPSGGGCFLVIDLSPSEVGDPAVDPALNFLNAPTAMVFGVRGDSDPGIAVVAVAGDMKGGFG